MPVQIGERRKIAAATFVFFLAALFLTAYSAEHPHLANIGSTITAEILRPFQYLHRTTFSNLGNLWGSYIALVNVRKEKEDLHQRNRALEAENTRLLEYGLENRRLRALLAIKEETGLPGMAAFVIAYDPSRWVGAVTVDKGFTHGVQRGMAVISGGGVVGQVVVVSPYTARVLLITDHTSGVDVIIQNSRARGIVEGLGGNVCQLRFVSREFRVKIGDRVLTSGWDGIYPKGLLVGVVADLGGQGTGLFHDVELAPAVDFSNIEEVFIVTEQNPALAEEGADEQL